MKILRALCDLGSQINLISGHAMQTLRLRKNPTHMHIRNVNGEVVAAKGIARLNLIAKIDDKVTEQIDAYVVPNMLHNLPKQKIDISKWNHIRKIQLADSNFNEPGKIDLLLGADFYSRTIINGIRKMNGAPTAQRTTFGWIVFGGHDDTFMHASLVNTITHGEKSVTNDELMVMLGKFWQLDHVPIKRYRTQEEQKCEDIFTKSITTDAEGRYIARMPLQPDATKPIGTYELAYARLMQMERRFARDPVLKENYIKFMHEYEALEHMELVLLMNAIATQQFTFRIMQQEG